MGYFSKKLEPLKLAFKHKLRWRYTRREWFLGRHACLGYDVLKLISGTPKEVNLQKGRVDLLLNLLRDPRLKPKAVSLRRLMCREDVLPLIKQLEFFDCLPKKSPKFILMDSFSELTDQLFESRRDQWLFACAYGDVSHTTEFESQFKCHGLLPVESLEKQYLALFNAFEARWGLVPILFLHFPIALEKRQLYIDRHHGIVEVIQKISKSVKNLTPIQINEVEIAWPEHVSEELKNFPYHYDVKTYEKFKVQLDGTGLFR